MSDTLPTIWAMEPHTAAKHRILEDYLKAWFPILSHQTALMKGSRILYVDGFAGPGSYTKGESGSPVIAVRAATEHEQRFPCPVEMLFIEADAERHACLREALKAPMQSASKVTNLILNPPECGTCDAVLGQVLDEHEKRGVHFGPALAFLDQFGYGSVSMELIRRILAYPQCEVFSYLDYKDMNRWITDPTKAPAFDRAYGGAEWIDCKNMPEGERRAKLLDLYKAALRTRGNAKYVVSFLMYDKHDVPLYWLIFCTNHIRGLEEMKKAMWRVDTTGEFRFSDKDAPGQLKLLRAGFDQEWLAEEMRSRLAGRTLTVAEIKEFVLVETPCCLFKEALKALETGPDACVSLVTAPKDRRAGDYPDPLHDVIRLRFDRSLF